MTFKELNAGIMVASAVAVSAWVAFRALSEGVAETVPGAAAEMLWAVGYMVAINIVAVILSAIVGAILQRQELQDERADERDRAVYTRSMAHAYFIVSIGILGVLVALAAGLDAVLAPYALFAISALAGTFFAAAQLVYYRVG